MSTMERHGVEASGKEQREQQIEQQLKETQAFLDALPRARVMPMDEFRARAAKLLRERQELFRLLKDA
jgi:hypothetical protein